MNPSGIIAFGAMLLGVLLFVLNFTEMLKFKWYMDYFHIHDKTCKSRYEAERYRYRMYAFLYNLHDDAYASIYKNYKTTYFMFITYFSVFVTSFFIASYYTKIYTSMTIYAFILIIWITYTTVNGILLDGFNKINKDIMDSNKFLYKYNAMYKITNAIMHISNMKDKVTEYSHEKLPSNETIDTVIEHNIGILENINNIAKIRIIKKKAYDSLDFVKYLVLDSVSPYYIKYFDNMYISLPDTINIYLKDIHDNRNSSLDQTHIDSILKGINEKIIDSNAYENFTYKMVHDSIRDDYPSEAIDSGVYLEKIMKLFKSVHDSFYDDKSLKAYDFVLYEGIEKEVKKVQNILEVHTINKEYDNINKLIHEALDGIDVENDDYIQYFLSNRDVIFEDDTQSYKRFIKQFKSHGNYIYAYLVYIVIALLLLLHYMYVTVNHAMYSYIVAGAIVAYFITVKSYSHFNLMSNI